MGLYMFTGLSDLDIWILLTNRTLAELYLPASLTCSENVKWLNFGIVLKILAGKSMRWCLLGGNPCARDFYTSYLVWSNNPVCSRWYHLIPIVPVQFLAGLHPTPLPGPTHTHCPCLNNKLYILLICHLIVPQCSPLGGYHQQSHFQRRQLRLSEVKSFTWSLTTQVLESSFQFRNDWF